MRKMLSYFVQNGISRGRAISPSRIPEDLPDPGHPRREVKRRPAANPDLSPNQLENALKAAQAAGIPVSEYLHRLTKTLRRKRQLRMQ